MGLICCCYLSKESVIAGIYISAGARNDGSADILNGAGSCTGFARGCKSNGRDAKSADVIGRIQGNKYEVGILPEEPFVIFIGCTATSCSRGSFFLKSNFYAVAESRQKEVMADPGLCFVIIKIAFADYLWNAIGASEWWRRTSPGCRADALRGFLHYWNERLF